MPYRKDYEELTVITKTYDLILQGERIPMFLLHKELWNYEFTLKEHLAI